MRREEREGEKNGEEEDMGEYRGARKQWTIIVHSDGSGKKW